MNENYREQISALMDGELENMSPSILKRLSDNHEHRQIWCRYHLIGESLRGNLPRHIDQKLADRVGEAIKNEPNNLAPRFTVIRFIKPVMGFAIAASVAVVAILGVRQTGTSPSITPTQPIAVHQPEITSPQLATLSKEQETQQASHAYKLPADATAMARLNRYLVNYNEYRTNAGVQGMLPYVRIVADEGEE
ncbi:MAG: sigma-E factor negative regulatory protein [Gammaproteobacteria bacterium]|nr:sigma-E factor negative regulatory protein [Gammaproteobacteria bacterium]